MTRPARLGRALTAAAFVLGVTLAAAFAAALAATYGPGNTSRAAHTLWRAARAALTGT